VEIFIALIVFYVIYLIVKKPEPADKRAYKKAVNDYKKSYENAANEYGKADKKARKKALDDYDFD
jgi:hypothetical protein